VISVSANMPIDLISAHYHSFANEEAHRRSPLYEAITRGIAGDAEVLHFLESLPQEKQQPTLLLAAVRHRLVFPMSGRCSIRTQSGT
jgi:Uncharacterized protein conserved in bacteria (DUF2332)